ncbi:hypothetical protein CL617_05355 [archaeon]|nr:hypothetical protein [archaeon]|tara:strand:+ start:3042 stop:3680 length:639 start_codon:yes stop_codon:yes gene_type:complete
MTSRNPHYGKWPEGSWSESESQSRTDSRGFRSNSIKTSLMQKIEELNSLERFNEDGSLNIQGTIDSRLKLIEDRKIPQSSKHYGPAFGIVKDENGIPCYGELTGAEKERALDKIQKNKVKERRKEMISIYEEEVDTLVENLDSLAPHRIISILNEYFHKPIIEYKFSDLIDDEERKVKREILSTYWRLNDKRIKVNSRRMIQDDLVSRLIRK